MHIVFISQIVPYPPHGGVSQRGFNLLRELGRHHRVDFLAFIHPEAFRKETDLEESRQVLGRFCSKLEYFRLWPKRSVAHKYTAFLASVFYSKPFSVMAHRSAALERRFKQILGAEKPDLVHLDTIALASLGNFCGNVPVVLAHHNIESLLMKRRANLESTLFRRWFAGRQAGLLSDYETKQSPRFPLNIMVSDSDADYLRQAVPVVRTIVVENGVDTEYFQPRAGEEQRAVIYTGGMNMFANRDAVLWFLKKVWPLIKQKAPDLQFYAVGQNPPAEISNIADADASVKVTGFVEDIRPWVAKSSVYVVPLRVGGGTRLKVVDAMAQGKAIVSTSIGCEGIRVKDGIHVLIADDQSTFAQKVLSLLENKETRMRLGQEARKLAKQEYDWQVIGQKLVEGYKKVCEKH